MTLRQRLTVAGLAGLCAYLAVGITFVVAGLPSSSGQVVLALGLFIAVYVPAVRGLQRITNWQPAATLGQRSSAGAA
jgi:peptidoglycan/LPS O-acetylase OafA/YrhL